MKHTEERTILLVEDNSDDIALIQRLFERHNLMNGIDVVSDGKEALDYVFARGPYTDRNIRVQPILVLLDSRLPKLDGLEVLQRLRSNLETEALPVIMMTDDKKEMKTIRGHSLGVKAFLRKPFSFAEFVRAARKTGLRWMLFSESLFPEKGD
jgi:two-component system response regulator